MLRSLVFAFLLLSFGVAAQSGVAVKDGTWTDTSRKRDIPYRLYHPEPLAGPSAVVLISHGLGGSRAGNAQLGRHLAARGFIAIALQHPGSDASLIGDARNRRQILRNLTRSLRDQQNILNRLQDVPFAVAALEQLPEAWPALDNQLDLERIGMAGHSYGAISTLVAAGQRMGPQYLSFKVGQIRAGVVLSPSPPNDNIDLARAYRDIDIPLFHITGTQDAEPIPSRDFEPGNRADPYRNLAIQDQYLLILDGAEHATLSGSRIDTRQEATKDADHLAAILNGAYGFFQAYLYEREDMKEWLRTEYRGTLEPGDVFEYK